MGPSVAPIPRDSIYLHSRVTDYQPECLLAFGYLLSFQEPKTPENDLWFYSLVIRFDGFDSAAISVLRSGHDRTLARRRRRPATDIGCRSHQNGVISRDRGPDRQSGHDLGGRRSSCGC